MFDGSAIGQSQPFAKGTTKATALVAKIAPGVGSLELAITSGVAVSETRNDLAQAQAQALDLGLIGTTLTAEGCSNAPLTPEQLPQPLRVDNRSGNDEAQADEAPLADALLGGGRKQVEATKDPSAHAIVTGVAAALDPAVRINGGRAEATSGIVEGKAREAHAVTTASVSIAGLVELTGLRWEAFHRTGDKPEARGAFSLGSLAGAQAPVDLDQLEAVESAVNTALALTGISIDMPKVERFTKPTDLVRVTPLRILLKDSPLGAAVLGPLLNASRAQREDLFDQLSAAICEAAGVLLVGDIGVSVLSGTGFIAFEIGGAEATTAEIRYTDPFGSGDSPPVVGGAGAAPASGGTGGGGSDGGPATGETVGGAPAVATGPTEEVCESVHPFKWPPCSRGAALPIGLAGLMATAAVGVLDWRHQRSRREAA